MIRLIVLTLFSLNSMAFTNGAEELLSSMNIFDGGISLKKRGMHNSAKDEFKRAIKKAYRIDIKSLSDYQRELLTKLKGNLSKEINSPSSEVSRCESFGSWLEKESEVARTQNDKLKRYQTFNVIRLKISEHSSCKDSKNWVSKLDKLDKVVLQKSSIYPMKDSQ